MGFYYVAYKKMKSYKADCKINTAYVILERTDPLLNIWRIKTNISCGNIKTICGM